MLSSWNKVIIIIINYKNVQISQNIFDDNNVLNILSPIWCKKN